MPRSIASSSVRLVDPLPTSTSDEPLYGSPGETDHSRLHWLETYRAVRGETERRAAQLSPEDQTVQSMADASPTKWHRAHVTWFFEQFLLRPHARNYRPFDERFGYLYNSYYVSAGPRAARPQRGMMTRPGAAEVTAYRAHVDDAVARLIESAPDFANLVPIVAIGLNHEQQHQELLLTDILHAFSLNATDPVYDPTWQWPSGHAPSPGGVMLGGIDTIGHDGGGFCFDNERPAHQILLQPVQLSSALVTNGEWLDFMADGGYTTPTLWLSDGFGVVATEGWDAPGYWRKVDGVWHVMTLGGLKPVEPARPVCHVSYYEADAFARWSGKDLPTEAEWEVAAKGGGLCDAFGMVWQWTRSAYSAYPGYKAAPGALGEYNGKFMINQMVLRGSSVATPAGHSRPTYRNFFYPSARWQFSGLRLAEYRH